MIWFFILILVLFCIFSLNFRLVLFNLPDVFRYGIIDTINSIRFKSSNLCPTGKLNIYVGLFGKGKTLSAVHDVVKLYKRYDGKKVYDRERKKFVTQKVRILSNVELLSVPFIRLENLKQLVDCADYSKEIDIENDTLTITIALIDEMSVQLNSREFKKNINAQLLNTILCCRHYHMSIFGTAQRFNHVDALVRQVTQNVISCDKYWRLQRQSVYDAFDYENQSDVTRVPCLYKTGFFVTDKDYNAYDTLAVVGQLVKDFEAGKMLSDAEILALQCSGNNVNVDLDSKPKRKLFRFGKKRSA